jgi:hypothetical protein
MSSSKPALQINLRLQQKQGLAFQSKANEILYGGAAYGGKSHLMRVAAIVWCLQIPGLQVYLFRRLYDDLMKNHMEGPTSFPALLADLVEAKFCKIVDKEIEFYNGSKIFLCHCQHEKNIYKYQGSEMHVLMIDELTHFTEKMYRFLRLRVRLGSFKLPEQYRGIFPRIINGANPGNIGHNWVKLSFIDNAPPLAIKKMSAAEGGMRRQYIPAKLEDNPIGVENDPEYESRLEGAGSVELVKAMRWGDWDIVAGGMFDDVWKRERHAIKPFQIPKTWRVDRSFDWGSSKPFAVLWWAESSGEILGDGRSFPKGTLFLIHEWYGWNGRANEGLKITTEEMAKGIIEREKINDILKGHRVKPGPADSSIWDSENGSRLVDGFLKHKIDWKKADKSPGSRVAGWEKIRELLKASLAPKMEAPGLFVFNTCTQFIRTVPVLPRDENKTDDVDTEVEDHIGDAARYRVMRNRSGFQASEFNR